MLQDIRGWVTAPPITLVSRSAVHMAKLHTSTHISYHTRRAYFLHTLKHLYHREHTYIGFLNINAQYSAELPPYAVYLADKAPYSPDLPLALTAND